jgi:hypothetical protein
MTDRAPASKKASDTIPRVGDGEADAVHGMLLAAGHSVAASHRDRSHLSPIESSSGMGRTVSLRNPKRGESFATLESHTSSFRDGGLRPTMALGPYALNDRYQQLVSASRARNYGFPEHWTSDAQFAAHVADEATAIVQSCVYCVRCAARDFNTNKCSRVGPRSVVMAERAALVHVWQSRKEARRFHEALRRVAQAKFEHMIPSPIHVPLAALVCHQGAYVSVVWLPPVLPDGSVPVERTSAAWLVMDILRAALHLKRSQPLTLALGGDSRLYLLLSPSVVLHHTYDAVGSPVPYHRRVVSAAMLDAAPSQYPLVSSISERLFDGAVHAAAAAVVDRFTVTDVERTAALRAMPTTIGHVYQSGAVAAAMHEHGVPLRQYGRVLHLLYTQTKFTNRDVQPFVAAAATVIKAEMTARALVAILSERMALAMEASDLDTSLADQAGEMEASATLSLFFKDSAFFASTVVKVVKQKFFTSDDEYAVAELKREDVKPCLAPMMKFVAQRIGLKLAKGNKDFDGLATTCITVTRPAKPLLALPRRRSDLIAALGLALSAKVPRAVRLRYIVRGLFAAVCSGDPQLLQDAYETAVRDISSMMDPGVCRDESANAGQLLAVLHLLPDACPGNMFESAAKEIIHQHFPTKGPTAADGSPSCRTPQRASSLTAAASPLSLDGGNSPVIATTSANAESKFSLLDAAAPPDDTDPNRSTLLQLLDKTSTPLLDELFYAARLVAVMDAATGINFGPAVQANAVSLDRKTLAPLCGMLLRGAVRHWRRFIVAARAPASHLFVDFVETTARTLELAALPGSGVTVGCAEMLAAEIAKVVRSAGDALCGCDHTWRSRLLGLFSDVVTGQTSYLIAACGVPKQPLRLPRSPGQSPSRSPAKTPDASVTDDLSMASMRAGFAVPNRSTPPPARDSQMYNSRSRSTQRPPLGGLMRLSVLAAQLLDSLPDVAEYARVHFRLQCLLCAAAECGPAAVELVQQLELLPSEAVQRRRPAAMDVATLLTPAPLRLAVKPLSGGAAAKEVLTAALSKVAELVSRRVLPVDSETWTPVAMVMRVLMNTPHRFEVAYEAYKATRSYLVANSTPAAADESLKLTLIGLSRVKRVIVRLRELADHSVVETRRRKLLVHTEDIGFRTVLKTQESVHRDIIESEFLQPYRNGVVDFEESFRCDMCRERNASDLQWLITSAELATTAHADAEASARVALWASYADSWYRAHLASTVGRGGTALLAEADQLRSTLSNLERVERSMIELEDEEAKVRSGIANSTFTPAHALNVLPRWSLLMAEQLLSDFHRSLVRVLVPADELFRAFTLKEESRRRNTIIQLRALEPPPRAPPAAVAQAIKQQQRPAPAPTNKAPQAREDSLESARTEHIATVTSGRTSDTSIDQRPVTHGDDDMSWLDSSTNGKDAEPPVMPGGTSSPQPAGQTPVQSPESSPNTLHGRRAKGTQGPSRASGSAVNVVRRRNPHS